MQTEPSGRLTPVELRQVWTDEARDFTPWLASEDGLALLSDELGMELELEGTEVPVGPYSADILARDTSADVNVVIENQLERTNHDHLGKCIVYASGLDAEAVVWIVSEFREEHRRAVDFLNEVAAPRLRIYGLEVKLWKIGSSDPAPQFAVVARPNEYTEQVRSTENTLTDTGAAYHELWTALKDHMIRNGTSLRLRKAGTRHWFNIAVGRSGFSVNLTASVSKHRIGCEIYLRKATATTAFHLLEKQKDEVERELGTLKWMELPEGQDCRIVQYKHDVDVSATGERDGIVAWMAERAESFHRVFSGRIRALDLSDEDEAPQDEDSE